MEKTSYAIAQEAVAHLKAAIYGVLLEKQPMSNAEIGRALGIYSGHIGHEGHISRTLLAMMEGEGVVEQNSDSKKWKFRTNT